MLSLSQTTGYAVVALSCLAHARGRRLLAKDIADCTGIPKPYLSKLMNSLARSGLVNAKRGYRGGFTLTRPAEDISVAEIVDAVEGPDWTECCLLGFEECTDRRACPTHAFWKAEKERIHGTLERTSLREVAEFEHEKGFFATCLPTEGVETPGARLAHQVTGRRPIDRRRTVSTKRVRDSG